MEPIAGEAFAAAIIAAGLAAFGWLVKLALGETLRGIQASLSDLRVSVDGLARRIDSASERLADHDSRIAVAEDRLERLQR